MNFAIKKPALITASILALLLQGCLGQNTEPVWDTEANEKQPFFVETSTVQELNNWFSLKKTGKIIGSQDIVVSADIVWRVRSINANIGDSVANNQTIISLSDSSGSYSFASQRAKAWLDQARINYQQTMLSLNKAISDTSLAIKQAENQAQNAQLGIYDSGAQQQLNQLQSQLEKAKIDLETKITSDQQTVTNSIASARTLISSAKILFQDVITTVDEFLWVSYENKNVNNTYERYIWTNNTATKYTAENTLRQLLTTRAMVVNYTPTLTADNLASELRTLEWYISDLLPLLDQVDTVLTYSETGETFTQTQLSTLQSTINGLQTQTQTQVSSFTQQANTIESFLSTYKQQQESLKKSIASLEQQIAATKANLSSASVNTDIWLESAQNAYDNTLQNRAATEQALLNAITQAQIAFNETQNTLSKLSIEAPIDGIIGDILVDAGQEVSPGTPLFTIASDDKQEIEIALTADEVKRVQEGQSVTIINNEQEYKGTVVSIASSSSRSLTYKAIIRLDENTEILWWVARVLIPLTSDTILLPLKYIKIINSSQWSITALDWSTIETMLIDLWKVRGSSVEVVSDISENTEIIISDVGNYNPSANEIQRK